ncbi:ribose-phosphate diphosphokinase [Numidum massiliense]|uniref:ribose-phosphate diphosphokinase n=1 Tax=Numidum massiliense TaxID=1522315 RepID=UPI0006D59330|nr:ribose-phosphate pyrophosphokinase [Numidum massiliense]
MVKDTKLFAGSSNAPLARAVAERLQVDLGKVQLSRFKSGEIYVHYEESIRNKDVYLLQSFSPPINEHFVELMIMADAAKRASARSVNAIIPYYGYARQEKKDAPREPISAKLVADVLATAGIERVVTLDLHAPAIQGFFNIAVDHLTALDIITKRLQEMHIEKPVIVSPDAGRAKTAEKLATYLDAPFAIMIKRRPAHNEAKVTHIVGEVAGRTPVIIEDMIDTGGTIVNVVEGLREKGALDAIVCATHPVFSDGAIARLDHPYIRKLIVTDTLPLPELLPDRYEVLTVAPLIAQGVEIIQHGGSISTLFRSGSGS